MVNKLSGSVGHGRAWLGTHVRGAYRGSLSVVLKSKKLFCEGDVGYAMWVMGKFLRLGKFSMREIVKGDNL